ncbi:MAG: zinc-dependent metalloprotease [Bacteroidia bacterium]
MFRTILILSVCLCLGKVSAQTESLCGNSDISQQAWMPRYLKNIRKPQNAGRNEVLYIPVAFQLVARTNGAGRAATWRALEILCEMNELFAPAGFRFYLREGGIFFLNHDGIFNDHELLVNQQPMRNNRVDSAVNIFVVNQIASGAVGYYDSANGWIVVRRDVFKAGNKTTTHEMGHFFSLLHPHFGWDAVAWNAQIHGNPAPAIASDGITPTERADSSNCTTAGDMLCDTPPDYNFGLNWQQSCDYGGSALDPSGLPVDPDESLIMSYFQDNCRNRFSGEQIAAMQADYVNPERLFLHSGYMPSDDTISSGAVLVSPSGGVSVSGNELDFHWTRVVGAKYYYVETDRSNSFSLEPLGMITADTFATFSQAWLEDKTYYWRVWAYNDSYTCAAPSLPAVFQVSTVSGINNFPRQPFFRVEQAAGSREVTLYFSTSRPLIIPVKIINLNGQTCLETTVYLSAGEQKHILSLDVLPAGIYLVSLPHFSGKTISLY